MIYHTDIPLQQQPDCFDFSIDISDRPHLHAFFMLDLGWQVCVQRMIAVHCEVSGGAEGERKKEERQGRVSHSRLELPTQQPCLLYVPEVGRFLHVSWLMSSPRLPLRLVHVEVPHSERNGLGRHPAVLQFCDGHAAYCLQLTISKHLFYGIVLLNYFNHFYYTKLSWWYV